MRRIILCLAAAVVAAAVVPAVGVAQRDWNAPFPPHRIIDNIYFIGTEQLATFLVTTLDGHILINSDFESTVPSLQRNVAELGFEFEDIEIILGSHAHADHMEADALIKQITGAEVAVMAEDIEGLRAMRPGGKEHPIDRILEDGDTIELGGTTLTAHRTPGHTKGCTSWGMAVEEDGRSYDVLIVCSFGVNDNYVLVDNPDYPEIVADYRATFAKARSLPVDVFLGSHGFFYAMNEKYERLAARRPGDPNPFVDRPGYLAHVDTQERRFEEMLAAQQSAN
jgi:metallo-beta-lactamase class B